MTEQEAIKILNPDADVVWKAYDGKDMERCNEACRVACVALAKQIPQKPDYEGDGYDEDGYLIYYTWICPNCGKHYEVVYGDKISYPAFDLNAHDFDCNGLAELNESGSQWFYEIIGNIYDNRELLEAKVSK